MRVLVTGATGFIGANLVRELLASGYQVRALVRPTSNTASLKGLDVELAQGDITETASLGLALEGCQALFHAAAAYTLWHRHPQAIYRANVQGTENILAAAQKIGIEKVVYTSSVAAVGRLPHGSGTEDTLLDSRGLVGHYKRSKYLAEKVALRFAAEGLPVVIVNPSTPIGPWDAKPTPTGRIVLDFLNGRMPAYIDTGLNVVHVRDVARGHILALERGKTGCRYILGHLNLTMKDLLQKLAEVTGLPAPRHRLPWGLALALGYIDYAIEGKLLRREPRIPLEGVRMARKPMYYDASKAVRELGLPQTPIGHALVDAARWFLDHGYVKKTPQARSTPLKAGGQAGPG
ncbi:MAG: NAD-dependent epimerase/dehydratase family protein [Chloroflexi bacterium]|nr:NAD-dependent epimerase/dehydratase family protein [Chloroflexota bacterium]